MSEEEEVRSLVRALPAMSETVQFRRGLVNARELFASPGDEVVFDIANGVRLFSRRRVTRAPRLRPGRYSLCVSRAVEPATDLRLSVSHLVAEEHVARAGERPLVLTFVVVPAQGGVDYAVRFRTSAAFTHLQYRATLFRHPDVDATPAISAWDIFPDVSAFTRRFHMRSVDVSGVLADPNKLTLAMMPYVRYVFEPNSLTSIEMVLDSFWETYRPTSILHLAVVLPTREAIVPLLVKRGADCSARTRRNGELRAYDLAISLPARQQPASKECLLWLAPDAAGLTSPPAPARNPSVVSFHGNRMYPVLFPYGTSTGSIQLNVGDVVLVLEASSRTDNGWVRCMFRQPCRSGQGIHVTMETGFIPKWTLSPPPRNLASESPNSRARASLGLDRTRRGRAGGNNSSNRVANQMAQRAAMADVATAEVVAVPGSAPLSAVYRVIAAYDGPSHFRLMHGDYVTADSGEVARTLQNQMVRVQVQEFNQETWEMRSSGRTGFVPRAFLMPLEEYSAALAPPPMSAALISANARSNSAASGFALDGMWDGGAIFDQSPRNSRSDMVAGTQTSMAPPPTTTTTTTATTEAIEECTICFDSMVSQPLCILKERGARSCRHFYHLHCGQQLINTSRTCPICRHAFTSVCPVPRFDTDPAGWFRAMDFERNNFLSRTEVLDALRVTLPVPFPVVERDVAQNWAQWTGGGDGEREISFAAFCAPDGGLRKYMNAKAPSSTPTSAGAEALGVRLGSTRASREAFFQQCGARSPHGLVTRGELLDALVSAHGVNREQMDTSLGVIFEIVGNAQHETCDLETFVKADGVGALLFAALEVQRMESPALGEVGRVQLRNAVG